MPFDAIATPESLPAGQQNVILLPNDPWSDDRAHRIVRSDWGFAESFRSTAHDWRYSNADELYLAWCQQKYWEGTRVPRSSLGQFVVFQQVESLLPRLVGAATSLDALHFLDEAGRGDEDTSPSVMAWRVLALHQLGETRFREQLRRALKSMAIYGNGVLEVGVESYVDGHITFRQAAVSGGAAIPLMHPVLGPISVPPPPVGKIRRQERSETKLRPYIRYVSIKDFYVDPNCESTNLQDAGYCIKRVYMRAEDLKKLRSPESHKRGFRIPGDEYLAELSKAKSTAQQDVTKQSAELYRGNSWNPSQDYSSDPSQKRIAVVEYTTQDRKIWWLQGGDGVESVIFNRPNEYGFINYFSAVYADVPDRWHGLGVSDVAEGEQRLQQAIINARIDELALSIHTPMVKRRGVTIPAYQLKKRPGQVTEVENPAGDIVQLPVANITQQAYIEVEASANRVQRSTGMSDLAAVGAPSPGGNSANRTAMGVNAQVSATDNRTDYLLATIENCLVEPVINAMIAIDRKFMDTAEAEAWLKLDDRFSALNPVSVMNTRVTVKCRGAVRLAARMGFLQTFPLLAQTFLNPELLHLLAEQQHKTVDAEETMRMLMDAINYAPRNPVIVPLKPDQIQAMQEPPANEKLKAMLQQMRSQTDESINDKRLVTKLLDTLVKQSFGAHAKAAGMDHDHESAILQALLGQIGGGGAAEAAPEGIGPGGPAGPANG